ncbi:MAG: hypothetical protein RLZZ367_387 [Bacteroidota bacterium]|jgi:geranylgeranylglycerol-phosphate geranylgeranyltransferase
MEKLLAYLRLYRIDAFTISLLSFLVPVVVVSGGANLHVVMVALLISGISVNSAYTLNSWFDREIDAVNKPHRPIPSGIISEKSALYYSVGLIVLSFVWPWLINIPIQATAIILTIPVFGILYSNTVIPFKKNMLTAVFTTTYLMVSPAAAGLATINMLHAGLFLVVYLFGYGFAVIPLKDIEDVKGDVMHQSGNWSNSLGNRRLITLSLTVLVLVAAVSFFVIPDTKLRLALTLFATNTFIFLAVFYAFFQQYLSRLYRSLIIFDILQGAMGLMFYNCLQL